MSDSVIIFTFSPIQSFISEARRAEDLFNGSTILSELSRAAASTLGTNHLIYPDSLANDPPNVLVARIPGEDASRLANDAKKALYKRWEDIAQQALEEMDLPPNWIDSYWKDLWNQQINPENLWEVYWAAAPIPQNNYALAYDQARRTMDSLKRSRLFKQSEERGHKDSLSGKRAALHTAQEKRAKKYWERLTNLKRFLPSKIRPKGRERLDAIGIVKRFAELKADPFPSTSTVAAADFLQTAKVKSLVELHIYRDLLEELFGTSVFRPNKKDLDWPYDGDLLYQTTLTPERFEEDYHFTPSTSQVASCQEALTALYKACESHPSAYYAVVMFDGDHMGKTIDELLKQPNAEIGHKEFSNKIKNFANQVQGMVKGGGGFLTYNGGDDVVYMSPLSKAIPIAQALQAQFHSITGNTASAGIAIGHHQSPLDFTIEEARQAEKSAKNEAGRDALCVHVLKRSGEPLEIRSKWGHLKYIDKEDNSLKDILSELIALFESNQFSSRLAYSVQRDAIALSGLNTEARKSGLKVILKRQSESNFSQEEIWADRLNHWASALDNYLPMPKNGSPPGLLELGNWLILARFLASGGGE